jgi:hypothetical protein
MKKISKCKGCLVYRYIKQNPNKFECELKKKRNCPCKNCLVKVTCKFGMPGGDNIDCQLFREALKS